MSYNEDRVCKEIRVGDVSVGRLVYDYHRGSLGVSKQCAKQPSWSVQKKRLFIESIINCYLTSPIVVSEYEEKECNGKVYDYCEVLDNQASLNAIIEFVNNEFGIIVDGEELYYDMRFSTIVQEKREQGLVQQKEPRLPEEVCEDFSIAHIPLTVITPNRDREWNAQQVLERMNLF